MTAHTAAACAPPKTKISVATRNCDATLANCLDWVASQAYPHREHVVIDGASTDGTVDLLQARRNQLATWVSEPDEGIYDALNKGMRLCTGDVISFMHADDVYGSTKALAP